MGTVISTHLPPPVMMDRTADLRWVTHMLCWTWAMYFSAAPSSGADEAALLRLWREKRGEVAPEDLSGNLIVQLGKVNEDLNRSWYERNTGRTVGDVQRLVKHSIVIALSTEINSETLQIDEVFLPNPGREGPARLEPR
jgi:hypothetical protein